jgi:chromosome segregation ATPase
MSDQPPVNGSRLDRIENAIAHLVETQAHQEMRLDRFMQALERIERNQQQLLTAQVLLTDAQRKTEEKLGLLADSHLRLVENQQRLEAVQQRLAETQQHTEERLNALIQIVDELIRRRPPEQA